VPGDLRKVSLLAIILLVVLRVSIGWHLMYEGLWKLSTQKTSNPWSAEGYLKNATGPMRPMFRRMTGDPDDLKWLDPDLMAQKWKSWREQFVARYKLDEGQLEKFNRMMDGAESFDVPLGALPPGLDLARVPGVNKEAIRFDADSERLIVDGKLHLLPSERDRLVAAAAAIAESDPSVKRVCDQFTSAVNRVYKASAPLSINEELEAILKQDPDRVGVMYEVKEGGAEKIPVVVGEVQYYRDLVDRFHKNYAKARTKSEWDHIDRQWTELQAKRREVVGPVQALEKKMMADADELLTEKQLSAGPVPEPMTPVRKINWRTMWGLTIIGLLLMLGLCTRASAVAGAALLTMFYLAMPPWPGVQELPSIEHNLFVNKVFVEMVALLAIAALPSGKWFGVDAIIALLFRRRPRK
jgi:uncharacterized membrane protein YphA (DoxX/SURF4 family)